MKPKDKTTFTVTTRDSVIGWDVLTDTHATITSEDAIDRIVDIMGLVGLESFLENAFKEKKVIDIIIFNEEDLEFSVEYDPVSEQHRYDDIYAAISLFRGMLEVSLTEFLAKVKTDDEENRA